MTALCFSLLKLRGQRRGVALEAELGFEPGAACLPARPLIPSLCLDHRGGIRVGLGGREKPRPHLPPRRLRDGAATKRNMHSWAGDPARGRFAAGSKHCGAENWSSICRPARTALSPLRPRQAPLRFIINNNSTRPKALSAATGPEPFTSWLYTEARTRPLAARAAPPQPLAGEHVLPSFPEFPPPPPRGPCPT